MTSALREEDPTDSLVGQIIGGRYRITGVIGQGGMGVVYGAMHLELEQPVAVKVLPSMYARDAETLKRFEQEAKTASRVRHPNVVQVFDLGRLPTGEPYLAMELLDGKDLESLIEMGQQLSSVELMDVLAPLAAALDALHAQNVVHRDVKPSNVFFAKNKGGGETVKLVDFGLATLTAAGEGSERLTRAGHVVGTAVYMPPEAARGALCGPPGDLYSLAVMAFELIAGRAPFEGQPMEVLLDKVSKLAPPLSEIAGRPFAPAVESLFASALDREPARRPLGAKVFVDALGQALMAAPVEAAKGPPTAPTLAVERNGERPTGDLPGTVEDRSAGSRRKRVALFAALPIAALALLALGSLAGGYAAPRPAPPLPTPIVPIPSSPVAAEEAVVELDVPAPPVLAEPAALAVAAPPTARSPRGPRLRATTPAEAGEVEPAAILQAPEETTPSAPVERPPDSTDRSATLLRDASSAMLHGEIPRARDLYREATLAAPRNPAAWRGLGLSSERLHLLPEARTAYERYLELAPDARDAGTVRDRLSHLGS